MSIYKELIENIFPEYNEITILPSKSYIGFWLEKTIIFKIIERKDYFRLEIKHYDSKLQKIYPSEWDVHKLEQLEELKDYKDNIDEIIKYLISKPTDEAFSCCSRFIECSNALKCVNPYDNLKRNCSYRKNLEKGFIFYGKNKNA